MLDGNLPEVEPLDERPVEALCYKCGDEVLLDSVLDILHRQPMLCLSNISPMQTNGPHQSRADKWAPC